MRFVNSTRRSPSLLVIIPNSLRSSIHSSLQFRTLIPPLPQSHLAFTILRCFHDSEEHHYISKSTENNNVLDPFSSSEEKKSKALQNAVCIGGATVASKILGMIREITLASVFGMGPVVTAYKHASVLPGFCTSVLGGVNGPIHLIMATTLSKLSTERGRKLIQKTNVLMFLIGGVVGAFIFTIAESIIYVSAPGLWVLAEGQISRKIAISQLRLMVPCVIFSGSVGLGFGYLSAVGNNFLACISPSLSSISIISSCAAYVLMKDSNTFFLDGALFGGIMIACGASLGAFLQWLIQVMHEKSGQHSISDSWLSILKDKDTREFFILMLPATLTSGMAQIASFTDLYFASFIPDAASGLSYAQLIAMAPLGLLSSVITLPLLPTFSELAKPPRWPSLMVNLKQAVFLCLVIVLPILSIMCVLAEPVIRILFQWSMFDSTASALVSSLIRCYSIGSPFYIIRELLVMVFYALGDSHLPFRISMSAIILNAFLDWLFVCRLCLGAHGLALSTSLVTTLSSLVLLHLLSRKLTGLVTMAMVGPLLQLVFCCIISALTTSALYKTLHSATSIIGLSTLTELLSVLLAGSVGACSFFLLAFLFPELHLKRLLKRLTNR